MGYMDESVLCSDKVRIMPMGTLYHFGVLESNVHMAWMRAICGRLKSDYSYTVNHVYNNFPWPELQEKQKERINNRHKEYWMQEHYIQIAVLQICMIL